MLIFSKRIFLSPSFIALAVWPFIVLRDKDLIGDANVINHERIHLRQQLEMGWIFYFIWYLAEFVFFYFKTRDFFRAYHSISFEREAYAHERDEDYLVNRKFWSFLKYYK